MAARTRTVTVVAWILQLLTAAMFLGAGGGKLSGAAPMVQMFATIGAGQWFRYVTGVIEVGGALLLLMPSVAVFGGMLLASTMVGAIIAHATVLGGFPGGPILLLCLSSAIIWLRRP